MIEKCKSFIQRVVEIVDMKFSATVSSTLGTGSTYYEREFLMESRKTCRSSFPLVAMPITVMKGSCEKALAEIYTVAAIMTLQ